MKTQPTLTVTVRHGDGNDKPTETFTVPDGTSTNAIIDKAQETYGKEIRVQSINPTTNPK